MQRVGFRPFEYNYDFKGDSGPLWKINFLSNNTAAVWPILILLIDAAAAVVSRTRTHNRISNDNLSHIINVNEQEKKANFSVIADKEEKKKMFTI